MGIDFPRYSNQILSFILGSSFRNRGAQIHTKKIVFKISFCDYGRLLTKPSYYSSQKHSQLYITIFWNGRSMVTLWRLSRRETRVFNLLKAEFLRNCSVCLIKLSLNSLLIIACAVLKMCFPQRQY